MDMNFVFVLTFAIHMCVHSSSAYVTCTTNLSTYMCTNITKKSDFPNYLPPNMHKVTLMGSDSFGDSFPSVPFTSATWANVYELSILEFSRVTYIEEDFLKGLKKLKFLSISSCSLLGVIHSDLFNSTPELESLYLNRNHFLKLKDVAVALRDKLNNLKYLSLIGIQLAKGRHIVFGEELYHVLRTRNLTYFDISGVKTILVEYSNFFEIFSKVRYLNMSSSTLLSTPGRRIKVSYFQNLEVLDITNCINIGQYGIKHGIVNVSPTLQQKIKYIFAQGASGSLLELRINATWRFEDNNLRNLKVLDLSRNNIIIWNITFIGRYDICELELFNLSSNNLEYINPAFLAAFYNLKILDLSFNTLHKMLSKEEFSNMFSSNEKLEIISLRNNNLINLPSNLFSSNTRLRIIDLSHNGISYFNIDIRQASNLRFINLRNNLLNSLPESFLGQLNHVMLEQKSFKVQDISKTDSLLGQIKNKIFIARPYMYGYNDSADNMTEDETTPTPLYVTLNILDNPLICDCHNIDLVKWILGSHIAIDKLDSLACTYDSKEVLLNNPTMQMLQFNCFTARPIYIGVPSTIAIIAIIVTIVVTNHLRLKNKRQKRDFESLKRELVHENRQFKYSVFLSYCSRDSQIVEHNILPELSQFVRNTFDTQLDLVSTGSDHFVPGLPIIDEIHRCINESLVIVPVITQAFLDSGWCLRECVQAIEKDRKIIVLMEEHTDTTRTRESIKHLLNHYTRASWSITENNFHIRPQWNTICDSILQAAIDYFRNHRNQENMDGNENVPLVA